MSVSVFVRIRSFTNAVRCGFRVGSNQLRFLQHTSEDCGPACARLLLALRGLPVGADIAPTARRDGISAADLAAALKRAGVPVRLLDPDIEVSNPRIPRIDLTKAQHYTAHFPIGFRGSWKFDPARFRSDGFSPDQSATLVSLCVEQAEDRWNLLIAAQVASFTGGALRSPIFLAGIVGVFFALIGYWSVTNWNNATDIDITVLLIGLALAVFVSRLLTGTAALDSRMRLPAALTQAALGAHDRIAFGRTIIVKKESAHAQDLSWSLPSIVAAIGAWAICGLWVGTTAALIASMGGVTNGIVLSTGSCTLGILLQANLNQLTWRTRRGYAHWDRRRAELEKQPLLVAAVETTLSLITKQLLTYWLLSVRQQQRRHYVYRFVAVVLALGAGVWVAGITQLGNVLAAAAVSMSCSVAGATLACVTGLRIGSSFFRHEQAACRVTRTAYGHSSDRPCRIRTSSLIVSPGESSVFQLGVPAIDIAEGSLTTISGASGSGKSVLLAALAGALQPTSGTVTYVDHGGRGYSHPPSTIGLLTERDLWYDGNVMAAFMNSTDARLDRESVLSAARTTVESLPLALKGSASLSFDAIALSSSERKRLRVACALAGSPSVVFLDNPLTGIGDEHAKRLRHAVLVLKATRVVVTDDWGLRKAADLQLVCENGIATIFARSRV